MSKVIPAESAGRQCSAVQYLDEACFLERQSLGCHQLWHPQMDGVGNFLYSTHEPPSSETCQ